MNKKGFTLIELLAVIVMLAIIALIVTPVVSNIVSNARIAANARSVEGHIRNIELAIISKAFQAQTTGNMDEYDTGKTAAQIEALITDEASGTNITNDKVTCTSYTILHGKVQEAIGCKDRTSTWTKSYKYTIAKGAETEATTAA